MKVTPFTLSAALLLLPGTAGDLTSQSLREFGIVPPTHTTTLFYPFYDGVQMIEIDNLGFWEREVNYMDGIEPRGHSFRATIPPPPGNIYLFRDTTGRIIKAFGIDTPLEELTELYSEVPLTNVDSGSIRMQVESHRSRLSSRSILGTEDVFRRHITVFSSVADSGGRIHNAEPGSILYGLIDTLGNIVVPMEYRRIRPLGEDLLVQQGDHWGVLDMRGDVVVPIEYDSYVPQYPIGDRGRICFRKGGALEVAYRIDTREIIPLDGYTGISWLDEIGQDTSIKFVPFGKNGKVGFLDTDFRQVIPPTYNFIELSGRTSQPVRFVRDGKWGFLNHDWMSSKAREIIPPIYDYCEPFTREGRALVLIGTQFGCIDEKGSRRSDCPVRTEPRVVDGFPKVLPKSIHILQAERNGNEYYGLIESTTGTIILPPIYREVRVPTRDTTSFLTFVDPLERAGVINLLTLETSAFAYSSIELDIGYMITGKDGKYGLMDTTFTELIPHLYDELRSDGIDNLLVYTSDGRQGLITYRGDITVPALSYERIDALPRMPDGRAVYVVSTNQRSGIIDQNGTVLLPQDYRGIRAHSSPRTGGYYLLLSIDGKWGVMDTAFRVTMPFKYDGLSVDHQHNRLICWLNDRNGVVSLDGELIIPFRYDRIVDFSNTTVKDRGRYYRVYNGMKQGAITADGTEVIPVEYDEIHLDSKREGVFLLTRDGVRSEVRVDDAE